MNSISEIAVALNLRADGYEICRLQQLRSEFTGKRQMRTTIFDVPSKGVNEKENWAYHYGGRSEVQFNIGIEDDLERFRFGLAFSLEPSQFVRDVVDLLSPKIERFNELVISEPDLFLPWRMWIWSKGKRLSPDAAVRPIAPEEALKENFIFFGASMPTAKINLDTVLEAFDQLLPVYRFVQGHSETLSKLYGGTSVLNFVERFNVSEGDMHVRSAQSESIVELKSRQLTFRLQEILLAGGQSIALGTEISSGSGGRIDVVARTAAGLFDLYEIKPAVLARHAIRQALPQLLEYAYRSDNENIGRLYIVSQARLDEASASFLLKLREKGIPIHYLHIPMST